MVALTVEVPVPEIDRLMAGFDAGKDIFREELHDGLSDAVEFVEAIALDKVPHRTGRLSDSIGSRVESLGSEWLGGVGIKMSGDPYGAGGPDEALDTAPYAAAVELGADKHVIRPQRHFAKKGGKRKAALWWEGAAHPVHSVNHPGQRAQHFLRNSLFEAEPDVRRFIRAGIQRALDRIREF